MAQGKGFLAAVTAAYAELGVLSKEIKNLPELNGHLAPLVGIFCRCAPPQYSLSVPRWFSSDRFAYRDTCPEVPVLTHEMAGS
jgi:hypothetical protein